MSLFDSRLVIALAVFFILSVLVIIFLLIRSNKGARLEKSPGMCTTKKIVWICLINGFLWVWCSYILAYIGREQIAESLSQVAVTEIIGVVLVYCAKALFEKRDDFGGVNSN